MPEITLRRAAQIANTMRRKIDGATPEKSGDDMYSPRRRRKPEAASLDVLSAMATVDVDTVTKAAAERIRSSVLNRKAELVKLMEIYAVLRTEIASANERSGVSETVTQRVMLLRHQKIIADLLQELVAGVFDPSTFEGKMANVRGRLSAGRTEISMYGADMAQRQDRLSIPVLTADDQKALQDEAASLTRALASVDDRLAMANSSTKITVDDDIWAILRNAGLV